jgi:hypothetical protein
MAEDMITVLKVIWSSTQVVHSVRAEIVADLGVWYNNASSPNALPSVIDLVTAISLVSSS